MTQGLSAFWSWLRRAPFVSVWTPLTVLLIMGMIHMDAPGLHFDETNHTSMGIDIMHPEMATIPGYSLPDNALDRSRRFPIVGGTIYNTVVTAYLGIPFFELFGYTIFSHRLFELAFALAITLLSYRLFAAFSSKGAAFCAALLLATEPSFVLAFRGNAFMVFVELIAFLPAVYVGLLVSARTRSRWLVALLGVLAGFSCTIYFSAAPLVAALGLLVVIRRRLLRQPMGIGEIAAGLGGFVVGIGPELFALISIYTVSPLYLTQHALPFWAKVAPVEGGGTVAKSWLRAVDIGWSLLTSEQPNLSYGGSTLGLWASVKGGLLAAGIIGAGGIGLLVPTSRNRVLCALAALLLGGLLVFALLLSGLRWWHLAPVFPFVYFALIACLDEVTVRQRKRLPFARLLAATLVGVLALGNVVAYLRIVSAITRHGGSPTHAMQIPYLAHTLRYQYQDHYAVFLSPALHLPVKFLTAGRIDGRYLDTLSKDKLFRIFDNHPRIVFIATDEHRVRELMDALKSFPAATATTRHISEHSPQLRFTLVICELHEGLPANSFPVGSKANVPFGARGARTDYQRAGWSSPEKWGIWSTEKHAHAVVPAPADHAKFVAVKARAIVRPGHPPRRVRVFVGGSLAGVLTFTRQHAAVDATLPIPADLLHSSEPLTVDFVVDELVAPAAAGYGSDVRATGIGLMGLWLE